PLRFGRRLHARVAARAHVGDERGHPVHVLLDATRDVAEGGRVVRPDQCEQIREALPPTPWPASNTRTRRPSPRSRWSWYMPEMPAPMTTTSYDATIAQSSIGSDQKKTFFERSR